MAGTSSTTRTKGSTSTGLSTSTRRAPTAARDGGVIAAPSRRKDIALRGLQILTSLFFLASGVPKLIAHPSATAIFDKIGFGDWFMYSIGVLEVAGAVALVVPLLSGLAALGIIGLMTGAFITTLVALDGQNAATPVIVAAVASAIAWGRRRNTAELFALVRKRG